MLFWKLNYSLKIDSKRNVTFDRLEIPFEPHQTLSSTEGPIKVRVITAALAYSSRNLAQIPPMESGFSPKSTLDELREEIAKHLSIRLPNSATPCQPISNVCNCSFARTIGSHGQFKIGDIQNLGEHYTDQYPYLLIHSNNVIEIKYDLNLEEQSLKQSVRDLLQNGEVNDT